jgi:hypothetical protein
MTHADVVKCLRNYAVTLYGVVVLIVVLIAECSNPQYDSGGFSLLYFLLAPILGFMFYLPDEIMSAANDGRALPGQHFLSVVIGLLFCLGVDAVRRLWRGGS